jgi:hypothetical protein
MTTDKPGEYYQQWAERINRVFESDWTPEEVAETEYTIGKDIGEMRPEDFAAVVNVYFAEAALIKAAADIEADADE